MLWKFYLIHSVLSFWLGLLLRMVILGLHFFSASVSSITDFFSVSKDDSIRIFPLWKHWTMSPTHSVAFFVPCNFQNMYCFGAVPMENTCAPWGYHEACCPGFPFMITLFLIGASGVLLYSNWPFNCFLAEIFGFILDCLSRFRVVVVCDTSWYQR